MLDEADMMECAIRTAVDASLSDVCEGAELAVASSEVKSIQGLTMLFAPVAGGYLTDISPYLPFAIASFIGELCQCSRHGAAFTGLRISRDHNQSLECVHCQVS